MFSYLCLGTRIARFLWPQSWFLINCQTPAARDRTKGTDPFHVGKGSHRVSGKQVLSKRKGSFGWPPFHSEGVTGDHLPGSVACIPSRPDPSVTGEVPVLFCAFQLSGEPKALHSCSGDLCSFPRRLAPEKPAGGPPHGSCPEPSLRNCSPELYTQPRKVNPNSRLCLYRYTLSKQSRVNVSSRSRFREAASQVRQVSWQSMLQLGNFSRCWGDWRQYQILCPWAVSGIGLFSFTY